MRYNPPPGWPKPPEGWTPPAGWQPDPSWGPVPPGWQLWIRDPYARPPLPVPQTSARSNGSTMIVVAVLSCGLAGFVPPLWAARQRPHDAPFRKRMHTAAAVLGGLTIVGAVLLSAGDTDAEGSPTGFIGGLGSAVVIINLILAVTLAIMVRDTTPTAEPAGVAEARSRRQLRQQYRQIATEDPSLARSMHIGRPDISCNLDDGGLLDLNTLPVDQLEQHAGLSAAEAARVAQAREQLGRFTSIDEVALYAELPDATVTMLRERALFF